MKTKSLFIALFTTIFTFCFYANAQDSIKIIPDTNLPKNVCPKEIAYYLLPPNSLYTNMKWKVTGGHFNYANSSVKELFNTSDKVAVFWDNVASVNGSKTTGTVEVEVYISSQQKTLKGKYVQNIKSLNGVSMTKLETNIPTELPYEIKEFRVVADKLQFPKLTYDNGDPLNAKKYEWTLPAGWKSKSGKTGAFILEQPIPILDVITDANTNGTIKVRAINDCLGLEDASKYSELKFTRKGLGLGDFPQAVPLGEVKTYTFSVVGTEGTFEWQAPAGWKINGGGNTFTGGKSVQITTNKCPTKDSVQVRLAGSSSWTKFPTTVQLPSINIPAGEIKQYQSVTLSLDMPNANIASVEWFVNGNSVSSVANASAMNFAINTYGKVKISAKLILNGCSSITIPEIEVNVTKAPDPIISGPSTICDQATYTIENLPQGAPVQWSVSNTSIASINTSGVLTRRGNGICEVRAIINIGGTSLSLKPIKVQVGAPNGTDIILTVESSNFNGVLCTDNPNAMYANHPSEEKLNPIFEYEWNISSGWQIAEHPGNINELNPTNFIVTVIPINPGFENPTVSVRARNGCGWGSWKNVQVPAAACRSGQFSLSPNPATDVVTLQLQEESLSAEQSVLSTQKINKAASGAYEIQLWSGTALLKTYTTDQSTFQIPVSGLSQGLYFVRVIKDGKTYTQKLLVN